MNFSVVTETLQHYSLFEDLAEEELCLLNDIIKVQIFPRQGDIYRLGDTTNEIFFLVKGTVKTTTMSEDNREVIKSIYHPISVFGELGMVGEERRQESASAMNETVECATLSVADFQQFICRNHSMRMKMLHLIGVRLLKAEQKVESLIFKDARARIIDFLKECADKRGRKVGFEMLFKHSLTQQDIANLTGTSRQTVTSVLNDLRKENLIYFNRSTFLIRDMSKL